MHWSRSKRRRLVDFDLGRVDHEGILLETDHHKAHHSKKEKQEMTLFEIFH